MDPGLTSKARLRQDAHAHAPRTVSVLYRRSDAIAFVAFICQSVKVYVTQQARILEYPSSAQHFKLRMSKRQSVEYHPQ